MQIIGFNLNKIAAKRDEELKLGSINTNTEFLNITKEEVPMLKDKEALKVSFKFVISYKSKENKDEDIAEIAFEGAMLVSVESEQAKEILKSWKKKETSSEIKTYLFNVILKRCSIKALVLEEELNLPPHIPLPRIK